MQPSYYVGLDLGQRHDYTALAVVEQSFVPLPEFDYVYWVQPYRALFAVRHLERLPLGTPYPQMVETVRSLLSAPPLAGRSTLVVDATGVGVPVIDLLRTARLGVSLVPVSITGGNSQASGEAGCSVPKRDLAAGLQLLFDTRDLVIASTLPHAPLLLKELQDFEVRLTPAGHDTYGAWRYGAHDDLVLAVALACWQARAWLRRLPTVPVI
jgi:hypothetical protein